MKIAVIGATGRLAPCWPRSGHKLRKDGPTIRCPIAVMPDGATSYRTTFYGDRWLAGRGVLDRVRR